MELVLNTFSTIAHAHPATRGANARIGKVVARLLALATRGADQLAPAVVAYATLGISGVIGVAAAWMTHYFQGLLR